MPMPPLASAADFRVWMQQVEDRLARVEGKRSVVVGGWVLADRDGQVVLSNATTGDEVVLAEESVPPEPET
jgi:hypothetical protein